MMYGHLTSFLLVSMLALLQLANANTAIAEEIVSQQVWIEEDGESYQGVRENGWLAFVKPTEDETSSRLVVLSEGDETSVDIVVNNQGGQPPVVEKVTVARLCERSMLVITTSFFFYVDQPSFVYERHLMSLSDDQFTASVFDDESRMAGGIVPARLSATLHSVLGCDLN